MDQPLDFSFHKGNPLAIADDLESPKPMPKPLALPLADSSPEDQSSEGLEAAEERSTPLSMPDGSVEVLETLSISPATVAAEESAAVLISDVLSTSISSTVQATFATPNPKRRAKVPVERGFTQMDWLKLTRTQPDLAGLRGCTNKRLIPMEEIAQHRTEGDAWTVLKGRVYNISPYLRFHPGGLDMLMQGAGRDCTALFNKHHTWVNAEFLLEKCLVGLLDVNPQKEQGES